MSRSLENYRFKAKLTFFVNPRHFYITKLEDEETRESIDYHITWLMEKNLLEQPQRRPLIQAPQFDDTLDSLDSEGEFEVDIKPGDMVLAWARSLPELPLRARVQASIEEPTLGIHFKVFFIDLGFEQWVHIEDVYYMPEAIRAIEPLAIKCCLDGIYPNAGINGIKWSKDAKDEFERLTSTNNGIYITLVYGLLNRYALNGVKVLGFDKSGQPTDVRETLLYLGLGQLMAPRDVLKFRLRASARSGLSSPKDGCELVKPIEYLASGSISWVHISHVSDPGLLYVQPLAMIGHNSEHLIDLMGKTKSSLEKGWQEKLRSSTSHIGQICGLKRKNRCYRVRIERYIMATDQVQILGIDFGWRKIVAMDELCLLTAEKACIRDHPIMLSKRIRLHNLTPNSSDSEWSPECARMLLNDYRKIDLIMFLVDENEGSAMLFDYVEEDEEPKLINISLELVFKRHCSQITCDALRCGEVERKVRAWLNSPMHLYDNN